MNSKIQLTILVTILIGLVILIGCWATRGHTLRQIASTNGAIVRGPKLTNLSVRKPQKAEDAAKRAGFVALPELPSGLPLQGPDTFQSLLTLGGGAVLAYAHSDTCVHDGPYHCAIPKGTQLQLIGRRGQNLFIVALTKPCKAGVGKMAQGYVAIEDIRPGLAQGKPE